MSTRKPKPKLNGERGSIFDLPIEKLIEERLVGVRRDTSLDALLRLFVEKNLSRVAVVDDRGTPVGVVSKTDLLLRSAMGEVKSVTQVMTRGVVAVPGGTSLAQASALMVRRKLHALVVTFDHRYGWLSATDVLRWVAARANGW